MRVWLVVVLAGCGRFGFERGSPVDASGAGFAQIEGGAEFTCGVFADRAYCWGRNDSGQLGVGDVDPRPTPAAVALPAGRVAEVSAGQAHACARMVDGGVWCWGADGVSVDSETPIAVTGLAPATRVSAGYGFTCAVAGGVWCWGDDSGERLGNGAGDSSATPVATIADAAVDVIAGGDHGCAALATGTASCWGHNDEGALGRGSDMPDYGDVPAPVVDLDGVTAVTMGGYHACAIDGGGAWCWGTGTSGELGDGANMSSNRPVAAIGLADGVTAIGIGGGSNVLDATCAVRAGALWCWGSGQWGRLGNRVAEDLAVPTEVAGLVGPVANVSLGWYHTCALLADGTATCWGRGDSGQLGDGGTATSYEPVPVLPPSID